MVGSALAADLTAKAPSPARAWDIAFGAARTSDYIFRGITQSNHRPSLNAYVEPRYNIGKDNQLYIGIAGNSISFPNGATAEIDIYGGWRPTFGNVTLDFGGWYYWYPGGRCFNGSTAPVFGLDCLANGYLPNGNVVTAVLSFWEAYAKATLNVTNSFVLGVGFAYTPSVLNSGVRGFYVSGNARYTFAALPNGAKPYISAEVGYWDFGTSHQFYCTQAGTACGGLYPNGVPYPSYAHWNVGFGWSWQAFTVDLRYSGTSLNRGDCNAFTSDHTAPLNGSVTPINPSGAGSSWCGQRGFVTLKTDLTANDALK